jgi:hypothetical protein
MGRVNRRPPLGGAAVFEVGRARGVCGLCWRLGVELGRRKTNHQIGWGLRFES